MLTDQRVLVTYLAANPDAQFFDGGTEALLRAARPSGTAGPVMRDDVFAAYAHLIDQYALAVGTVLDTEELRARYMLGIRGWLAPRLLELRNQNTAEAAASALAIRVPTIVAETAVFASARPTAPSGGTFFPSADFVQIAPGGTAQVVALSNDTRVPSLLTNDLVIVFGDTWPPAQLISVSVPPANASAVTAVLNSDQSTSITVAAGFTGVTWFDYRVRGGTGAEETGRVFAIVR